MQNYIPDQNKFKLSGPPQWWLRQLNEFDASLVVVPSRQGFYYRLAQRRPLNLSTKMVNDLMFQHSDTQMLASYGLIPVTTILATARWDNPLMWVELAERAPWRQGGADKVVAQMEAREQDAQKTRDRAIADNLSERAKVGWRSYQYRTGQRTFIDATKLRGISGASRATPSGQSGLSLAPRPTAVKSTPIGGAKYAPTIQLANDYSPLPDAVNRK